MSKTITSRVLRPHLHTDGHVAQRGETVTNDEARHRALAAKGYVAADDGGSPAPAKPKAPREGLTNSDFTARRSPLAGGAKASQTTTTRDASVAKGGQAKGK
jgi:hypothetical protein